MVSNNRGRNRPLSKHHDKESIPSLARPNSHHRGMVFRTTFLYPRSRGWTAFARPLGLCARFSASHLTCLQLRLTRFAVRSYAAWPWVHRRRTNDGSRSTWWHTNRYISKLTERHCLQVGIWYETGHYAIATGARFTSLREPQDGRIVRSESSGRLLN